MRKLFAVIVGILALCLAQPALATAVAKLAITTAQSAQTTTPIQFMAGAPENLEVDGGTTWIDIANCHFTTSSARVLFNLSPLTPVTTIYTATDGTMSANTAKDGVLGNWLRMKYTTVGTYAGGTTRHPNQEPRAVTDAARAILPGMPTAGYNADHGGEPDHPGRETLDDHVKLAVAASAGIRGTMAIPWFNARKAAAAFFAVKQGDSIPVLKLVKLI
jgi:hypothetical protein